MTPDEAAHPLVELDASSNEEDIGCANAHITFGHQELSKDDTCIQETLQKVKDNPPRHYKVIADVPRDDYKQEEDVEVLPRPLVEAISLPHVKVVITGTRKAGLATYCLVDSGASVSLLDRSFLLRLQQIDDVPITQKLKSAEMTMADGRIITLNMDVVKLRVLFADYKGRVFSILIKARSVRNLAASFILGVDFLQSSIVRSLRSKYIELNAPDPEENKAIKIPIYSRSMPRHAKLYLIKEYTIAPGMKARVRAVTPHPQRISEWAPYELAIFDPREDMPDFEVEASEYHVAEEHTPTTREGTYLVIVTNLTGKPLALKQAHYIANLGPIPQGAMRISAYQAIMEWRPRNRERSRT